MGCITMLALLIFTPIFLVGGLGIILMCFIIILLLPIAMLFAMLV